MITFISVRSTDCYAFFYTCKSGKASSLSWIRIKETLAALVRRYQLIQSHQSRYLPIPTFRKLLNRYFSGRFVFIWANNSFFFLLFKWTWMVFANLKQVKDSSSAFVCFWKRENYLFSACTYSRSWSWKGMFSECFTVWGRFCECVCWGKLIVKS